MPVFVDTLILVIRAFSILAAFQAVGGYLFLRTFGPEFEHADGPLRSIVRWSALTAVCAAMLYFFLVPVRMAGSFGGLFDPVLSEIVSASNIQPAQVAAFAGLALLSVSIDGDDELKRLLCAIGAGVTVMSFALTGHTTIHGWRVLLAPLLVLHVGIAAAWFGALWPLRIVADTEPQAIRTAVIERFSRYAIRAVPVLFAAGLIMAAIFLGSFAQLATGYGAMIGLKVAGFAGLLAIANYNRTSLSPAMAAGQGPAVRGFRHAIVVEAGVFAAVVLVTVFMTGLFAPEDLHGSFAGDHDAEVHD